MGSLHQPAKAFAPRMLVLGLDAADPNLIEKWCDDGILPTLGFLREEGAWIPLEQDPMPSAAVWPSIYTGTHPGKHGIYNGLQLQPGQQAVSLLEPSQCARPPFWRSLDGAGKRSIIMDVPFNYPLNNFNGIQILDWGSYERHYEAHSLPDDVLTNIHERFGAYPFGPEMSRDVPSSVRRLRRIRSQLLTGITLKGNVINSFASDGAWDFLMAVFSESHPAGHYFWSFHAEDQHKRRPAAAPELVTVIRDIYKAIDQQIARIIANCDERTTILVLSGQGMGPNHANWHLIPEVLSRLGYLVTKSKDDPRRSGQIDWLREIRDRIPFAWRRSLSGYLPGSLRDYLRVHWANSRIDWSQTRAYNLPTDQHGYIRINLKGREPQGVVEPGAEYLNLCDRISDSLRSLVNPDTGEKIVREVFHSDALFPGPERERLPDLIVTWNGDLLHDGAYSKEIGCVKGHVQDLRSGNHKPQGFGIFYGPGVENQQISQGRIVDIAPTILKYFGVNAPADFDGSPLSCVFSSEPKVEVRRTERGGESREDV